MLAGPVQLGSRCAKRSINHLATKQADTAVCQPSFVRVAESFAQALNLLNNNNVRRVGLSLLTLTMAKEEEEEDGR